MIASRHGLAARILPLLDLTRLGDDDPPEAIVALCAAARAAPLAPAAVCVHPEHVTTARRELAGTRIRVATVVNFPDGGDDPDRVARETRRALAAGADEIDLVLAHGAFLRGDIGRARQGVAAGRAACAGATLKLILETGVLRTEAAIRQASALGIAEGADFLKTSTGKAEINATPDAARWMLDEIARHGGGCGFKAAGGIRTLDDAAAYVALAEARLGAAWVHPARLRLGASALLDELRAELDAPA
jgi:deoxyribose-phosphate aldolase